MATRPATAGAPAAKFEPKPVHHPTPYVPAAGDVQKVVHIKDLLKCNHGGTVNLDPTVERHTEIKDDFRVVTDQDLLQKVTIAGCSKGCSKITSITIGLSKDVELTAGAIPVLRNLEAVTDKACTVTWKGFEFDADAAATYVDNNAEGTNTYHGWCARYVQNALREGLHMDMDGANAKDLGPVLESHGFQSVQTGTVSGDNSFPDPQKGDVAVFAGVPGHDNGHTAMWDGTRWVSDTKQLHFSANQVAYKGGSFTVYRSAGRQAHALPK
jgi:hypothetical protein